jgi:hypothetical protein
MKSPVVTFNEYHLGDNLIFLNWLRRVALIHPDKHFVHFCRGDYLGQLVDVIEGIEAIELQPLQDKPQGTNTWLNADGTWDVPFLRVNWVFQHMRYFRKLSDQMQVTNPVTGRNQLLFDYPGLSRENSLTPDARDAVLVINSQPNSGQFPVYRQDDFVNLVRYLQEARGLKCITIQPTGLCPSTIDHGLSVTQIGALAQHCRAIIGVDTGPMWPTFAANSLGVALRIVFCHRQIFPLTDNCITLGSLNEVPAVLDFWGL